MPAHLFTLISGAAWLGCALIAAGLITRTGPGGIGKVGHEFAECDATGTQGCLPRLFSRTLLLACFLFIPPGSLPPLIDLRYGGPVCFSLLWTALLIQCGLCRPRVSYLRFLPAAILLSFTLALLCRKADLLALPGGAFSLGSYVAEPVWRWSIAGLGLLEAGVAGAARLPGFPGILGPALMLLGFLSVAGRAWIGDSSGPGGARLRLDNRLDAGLLYLALLAVTAVLFRPLRFSVLAKLAGAEAFIADYAFFWLTVLLLALSAGVLRRLHCAPWSGIGIWAAGATLFSL